MNCELKNMANQWSGRAKNYYFGYFLQEGGLAASVRATVEARSMALRTGAT